MDREKMYVPREESFLIPVKYIVVRDTQSNLHMLQEHKIDDYWNVVGERPQSGSWI